MANVAEKTNEKIQKRHTEKYASKKKQRFDTKKKDKKQSTVFYQTNTEESKATKKVRRAPCLKAGESETKGS